MYGTITFSGLTVEDCLDAIREATSRIEETFTSGSGSSEDSSFTFELTAGDRPVPGVLGDRPGGDAGMTGPEPGREEIEARLEYLRLELRAERISWGELAELQALADHIDAGDVELLEAAGVPEEAVVTCRNCGASDWKDGSYGVPGKAYCDTCGEERREAVTPL